MPYKIIIKDSAAKDLKNIPRNYAEKIQDIIDFELSNNPYFHQSKIKKIFEPIIGYRYKVPPYRIIYQIDESKKLVLVHKIKHRKDVYKRFGIF